MSISRRRADGREYSGNDYNKMERHRDDEMDERKGSGTMKWHRSSCGSHSTAKCDSGEVCRSNEPIADAGYSQPFNLWSSMSGSRCKKGKELKTTHQPERDPGGKGSSIEGSRSSGSLIGDGSCGKKVKGSVAKERGFDSKGVCTDCGKPADRRSIRSNGNESGKKKRRLGISDSHSTARGSSIDDDSCRKWSSQPTLPSVKRKDPPWRKPRMHSEGLESSSGDKTGSGDGSDGHQSTATGSSTGAGCSGKTTLQLVPEKLATKASYKCVTASEPVEDAAKAIQPWRPSAEDKSGNGSGMFGIQGPMGT